MITNTAATSKVYSLQHYMWATYGFIRGIVSASKVGNAFCTPKWTTLIIKTIDNFCSSDLLPSTLKSPHHKISQQVG